MAVAATQAPRWRADVGVEAARHVDRENGRRVGVDRRHEIGGGALERAVEPGAEQRVEDQRGGRQGLGGGGDDRARPAVARDRRVAAQPRRIAEARDRHLPPGGGETAGGDVAVAAVVAGAGEHEDRAFGDQRRGGLGDRAAGRLHQRHAGDARRDGEPVGASHLGGGEKLEHLRPPSAAWMRRNSVMLSRSTRPTSRPPEQDADQPAVVLSRCRRAARRASRRCRRSPRGP